MQVPPAIPYPESTILRGGVGITIVRPIIIIVIAPILMPLGIYSLLQHSYGMAAFVLLPPLLCMLLFGPAVARAGSFELTTHRLWHKPWFRVRRAYALADLSDLDFDPNSGRVRCKPIGLDVAFVDNFDKLRGALAVWPYLARLPFPTPSAEPFIPWTAWQVTSTASRGRKGSAVVLGDMVAFIPSTFPPPSTTATAAGLAVNLLTLPLGIAMIPTYVEPPIASVLSFFYSAPQSVREFVLDALAKLMGGWVVGLSQARCTPAQQPTGAYSILLEVPEGDPISGHVPPEMAPHLLRRLPNVAANAPRYR